MEPLKDRVELASGNAFIEWLNEKSGSNYSYSGRADEAPDLIYKDGVNEIRIEHTGAYYDSSHAAFIWKGMRTDDEIIGPWVGCNPDENLYCEIKHRIEEKCKKDYGRNCVLLVEIPPGGTSFEELEELLLPFSNIPGFKRFIGIYVAGRFPITTRSVGGYRVITIKGISANM